MKKITLFNVLLILLTSGVYAYIFFKNNPALIIRESKEILVSQPIVDHKLPRLYTSYKHTGKPELVVTKVWREWEE